ncbi:RIP metalloprotease RseP [Acidomonas methanolica]|uniref:Zinc metalloprotease n=1 Tax=Acidomonas methanolica NBRC 104435 TaxID=1231351 RepID=A0A023D913_ACIMT|nr:RIP metalloprotease RseP [Acidomonas methanolica]MBU2653884.1 RIP metalloprotease RseP [Acidomonas methanolica]TCS30844.1 regulator of sigma E protease [Acidomonas methanolica]GAJ30624.1 zinc metallopeptidase [Acidomonas methanolica NBRC 104435]GBQ52713.1 zinc metallopeptidase [Acidomonas methanolica]GEK98359.1 zinc metalloprotease [Acidomonas methanolica NBRC 104435]
MHDLIRTILAFALVMGLLVFVHEFGHYLGARWRGVKVDVFSIGFGPALYRWHDRAGTEWRLSAFPLGGYVKPHGFDDPEDASPEQKAAWIPGRTFHDKPVLSRAIVIAAGPLFNFGFAILLFTLLFMVAGKPELKNEIAQVMPGSPAEKAGLKPGDVVTRFGSLAIFNYADLQQQALHHPGETTTLEVRRDGHDLTLPVTLASVPGAKPGAPPTGRLGVAALAVPGKPMAFIQAARAGVEETWTVSVETLQGLGQILTGQRSAKELGGTIRIAQMSGQVAAYGFASIISFMALLSVNLGLINLLPVPILDGGRLAFYAIEAARGRPVSRRVQEISFQAGFAVIAGVFLFSTVNDLSNLGLFHWLAHTTG